MIKNKLLILLISSYVSFLQPVYSEIEQIVLKWKPGYCTDSCQRDLDRRLRSIADVAEIKFQGSANQVHLRWRPDRRFSFTPINNAFRYIGVDIFESFITVRGTVTSTHREVILNSLGDGADFELLSPLEVNPGEAAIEESRQSYRLNAQTREKLLLAEDIHKVIVVQGRLFEPEKGQPYGLIIERMTIPPAWEQSKQHDRRR